MVGAGSPAFALMSYVIANMRPDATVGFQVELNVRLLAAVFGESEEVVQRAIDYLCAPDNDTTTPGDEGRRLVKVGTFSYRVVNGVHYAEIRNEEERREKNRERQAKHRAKQTPGKRRYERHVSSGLPGETLGAAAYDNGDNKTGDSIASERV